MQAQDPRQVAARLQQQDQQHQQYPEHPRREVLGAIQPGHYSQRLAAGAQRQQVGAQGNAGAETRAGAAIFGLYIPSR